MSRLLLISSNSGAAICLFPGVDGGPPSSGWESLQPVSAQALQQLQMLNFQEPIFSNSKRQTPEAGLGQVTNCCQAWLSTSLTCRIAKVIPCSFYHHHTPMEASFDTLELNLIVSRTPRNWLWRGPQDWVPSSVLRKSLNKETSVECVCRECLSFLRWNRLNAGVGEGLWYIFKEFS